MADIVFRNSWKMDFANKLITNFHAKPQIWKIKLSLYNMSFRWKDRLEWKLKRRSHCKYLKTMPPKPFPTRNSCKTLKNSYFSIRISTRVYNFRSEKLGVQSLVSDARNALCWWSVQKTKYQYDSNRKVLAFNKPNLASLRPVHLFASHWPKSWKWQRKNIYKRITITKAI